MLKEFLAYAMVDGKLASWKVEEKTIALAIRVVQNELPPKTAVLILIK